MRVSALLITAALGAAAAAAQQPPSPADRTPGASGPSQAAPKEGESPLNLQMKEVEIRGEVERPEVFYIIPRREARMELAPLSKDYSGEIMEPLLPGPFEERVRSGGARK